MPIQYLHSAQFSSIANIEQLQTHVLPINSNRIMWHFITYCLEIFLKYLSFFIICKCLRIKWILNDRHISVFQIHIRYFGRITPQHNRWNINFEKFFFPLSTSSMTNPSLYVHRLCQSLKKLNNALKSECEHEPAANIIQPMQCYAMTFTHSKFNSPIQIKAKRSEPKTIWTLYAFRNLSSTFLFTRPFESIVNRISIHLNLKLCLFSSLLRFDFKWTLID